MISVSAVVIFYAKVVNYEGEDNFVGVVFPHATSERDSIAVGLQKLDKLIICKLAGLRKTLHAATDFWQ